MELLIVIAVIAGIMYYLYAALITKKNKAKEALSGIDVQLKKRSNLIPNILTIAKKFMEHEKELITKVTELRAKTEDNYDETNPAAVKEHFATAQALDANMGQLMIAVEDYPELKSDETMLQAQRTYNEVEEQIAAARRFYNSAVTDLNNAIEIFPGNLLAGLAKDQPMPFYEVDEGSKEPVNAGDIL